MKCPACKSELRRKNAGNMDLDVCLGGCVGIWFDQDELNRVSAMAATSPIMRAVVAAAERGVPVLGVCNGFQVLTEARLLPGALLRNAGIIANA